MPMSARGREACIVGRFSERAGCLLVLGEACIRRRTRRGIAQPGSAAVLGTAGRRFKSCCPDHPPSLRSGVTRSAIWLGAKADVAPEPWRRRTTPAETNPLKYVYIFQSESFPDRYYVGTTVDLRKRLADHNAGLSAHTSKFRPWSLNTYIAFSDHSKADQFEAYLKTGSGRGFAKRHF
jgi:putative endonuclease